MKLSSITFSAHVLEQIKERGLSTSVLLEVLSHPDLKLYAPGNVTIFQKIVYESDKPYLYRVFVNTKKMPPLVITAYKTSKINKYEDKIR